MKTKRILSGVVLAGISLFMGSKVLACPPPPCTSCWTNWPDCDTWKCTGCESCVSGSCVDDDSNCGDPDCWDCNGGDCDCDISINSVTSEDTVCASCDVTFTASISGSCSCVDWSGGGDPVSDSGTCNFTTQWSSTGLKTITATPECGNSAQTDIMVVAVSKIQYDDPDEGWKDASTLYVHVGTTVDFKAIPDPAEASFPGGKPVWGGTSGASGTGATVSVTFDTLSSSISDYKTVTASDCGSTVTVNVIVYEFEGVLTPEDNFSGRSQERYGIEEIVGLSCLITPNGVSASQVGGIMWFEYGVGSLSDESNDGTATYDAEHVQGGVVLVLKVLSGPSKGDSDWFWPDVIKPTGTRMTRVNPNNVRHFYGIPSAGIRLYYWLDPTDVSFNNLKFGEGSCPTTNALGYFTQCYPNYPGGSTIPGHSQNYFGNITGGNSTTGCQVEGIDGASAGADTTQWAAGSYTWSIPAEYIDDTASRHSFGSNKNHVGTIQSNGDTSISKGGQADSAALNDPTSDW